ncbi:CidA/LrgA family protein [Nocardioides sp. LHG3406-4]|uniref:CidA/LrgA family protein n=1 Tax=Nocardioides sp. LHG3406-4 TaxID=2804575 RepID=UPI003CF0BA73
MLGGLIALLACQLVGQVVVDLTGFPVPGPVVGMVVLFAVLQWRRPSDDAGVVRVSGVLLRHLQLLFVPAGVGVVAYLSLLRADAVPIGVALVASWLAGLLTVGALVSLLGRRA